jgi:hypothetical protein
MREAGTGEPASLRGAFAALSAGHGPDLATALLRAPLSRTGPASPAVAQARLEQLLTGLVVTAVLTTGRARHDLDPATGDLRLRRREEPVGGRAHWVDWDGLQQIRSATADPAGTAAMLRHLADLGADLTAEVVPPREPAPVALGAITDLRLALRGGDPFAGNRPVDVLVYRTGLLLAPVPARSRRRAPRPADRVMTTADQVGVRPDQLEGGWWIPAGDVVGGGFQLRRGGPEIVLELAGGSSLTLTGSATSEQVGDPATDLRRLLPVAAASAADAEPQGDEAQ